MNIKEIVERNDRLPISEKEACYVIGQYVEKRKGVKCNATIEKNYGVLYLQQQYALMSQMLPHAIAWFRENLK